MLCAGLAAIFLCSCESMPSASDPISTLKNPAASGRQQQAALASLQRNPAEDPATNQALASVVSSDKHTPDIRVASLNELAERDLPALKTAIRRSLPRSTSWAWITRASQIIAERGWIDLTPALVSSLARPVMQPKDDFDRPEFIALVKLHGSSNIADVVYNTFVDSNSISEQGLRARCWDLLHRLGQRDRLIALLSSGELPPKDALLADLRASATELGIIPHNREEILWLRKLREPARADFWSRAVSAVAALPKQRRAELEMRDLPIIVSASLYDPDLLRTPAGTLYDRVDTYLTNQSHHVQASNFDGFAGNSRQSLAEHQEQLTWGDLAAMLIAVRAIQVPEVVAHVFNYAERDRADKTTEYGGIISLDSRDRFAIREFIPVIRQHDQRFEAPQKMLDVAYTSIFHFHLHAQNHRNSAYAGPGYGDINYANNTRANCLVFTFMNPNTMNVDYYRHDGLVIDLGEIKRPASGRKASPQARKVRSFDVPFAPRTASEVRSSGLRRRQSFLPRPSSLDTLLFRGSEVLGILDSIAISRHA